MSFLLIQPNFARRATRWGGLLLVLLGGAPAARSAEAPPAVYKALQTEVDTWLALRREQTREEERWLEQQRLIASEIELLEKEKTALLDEVKSLQESLPGETVTAVETNTFDWAAADVTLASAFERLQVEQGRLPTAYAPVLGELLSAWGGAATPEARLEVVLACYSQLEVWEQQITLSREIVPQDGKAVERQVIFLGTAHAWALPESHRPALLGTLEEGGWAWVPLSEEHGNALERAARILAKETPPEWVLLPLGTGTQP